MFPNIPLKCPILPGRYEALNCTVIDYGGNITGKETVLNMKLPNGLHRHILDIYSESDPKMARIEWTNEIRDMFREDNF